MFHRKHPFQGYACKQKSPGKSRGFRFFENQSSTSKASRPFFASGRASP